MPIMTANQPVTHGGNCLAPNKLVLDINNHPGIQWFPAHELSSTCTGHALIIKAPRGHSDNSYPPSVPFSFNVTH